MRLFRIAAWPAIPALGCLLLAALSHWRVFENDVFWQCRAGEEILRTFRVQHLDTWSSTAHGTAWHNFQWLSTVIFYAVKSLTGDYLLLPTLRAAAILAVLLALLGVIRKASRDYDSALVCAMILVPATYTAIIGRLQLRPDIFGALCFILMLGTILDKFPSRGSRLRGLLYLWLWSSLHGGTAPIGVGLYSSAVLFGPLGERLKIYARLPWLVLGILAWFATPNGAELIQVVIRITTQYDPKWIANPDHLALSPELFNPATGGLPFLIWGMGAVGAVMTTLTLGKARATGFFRKRFLVPCLLLLIGLTAFRMRVRLYSFLFFVPVLACGLESAMNSARGIAPVRRLSLTLLAMTMPIAAFFQASVSGTLGTGIDPREFPVESAQFLKTVPASHKFFNAYDFGGYLVDQLRDYPVAQDGREVLFESLFRELHAVQEHPEALRTILSKRGFETLLVRAPRREWMTPGDDLHLRYYPRDTWAPVFFDEVSIVYLKRIPAHQALIKDHEYRILSRSRDPVDTARSLRNRKEMELFRQEVHRCLKAQPDQSFCRQAALSLK